MNQNVVPVIQLIDLFPPGVESAFGNEVGKTVFQKLSYEVDGIYGAEVIGISLEGISRTDATFPRESVIAFIKSRRGEQGFYLSDFENQDLMDNWDYAARAKEQSLIVLQDRRFKVLGPKLNTSTTRLIRFIFQQGAVTTASVAEEFKLSPQNASSKLKKLYNQGLIVGSKENAPSGGVEYQFRAIRSSV